MQIRITQAQKLFAAIGYGNAEKWSEKKLRAKLNDAAVFADAEKPEDDGLASLFLNVSKAAQDGEAVELQDGGKKASSKASNNGRAGKNGKSKDGNGGGGEAKLDEYGARIGSRKAQINSMLSRKTPKTVAQLREEGKIPGGYREHLDELAKKKVVKGDHKDGWVLVK